MYQINQMRIELFAYVSTFLWSNGSEKALLKIDIAPGPLPIDHFRYIKILTWLRGLGE